MKRKTTSVDIIVPVYNTEPELLRGCIGSALGQSYKNISIIVVDDGSTDKDTLKELNALNGKNISLFRKSNGGVSSARNLGLKKSKGDFVLFLDADDKITEGYVERLIEVSKSTNSKLVFSGKTNLYSGAIDAPFAGKRILLENDAEIFILNAGAFTSQGVLIDGKLARSFRFDESMSIGEDVDYISRIIINNAAFYEGKGGYYINENRASATGGSSPSQLLNYLNESEILLKNLRTRFGFTDSTASLFMFQKLSRASSRSRFSFSRKNRFSHTSEAFLSSRPELTSAATERSIRSSRYMKKGERLRSLLILKKQYFFLSVINLINKMIGGNKKELLLCIALFLPLIGLPDYVLGRPMHIAVEAASLISASIMTILSIKRIGFKKPLFITAVLVAALFLPPTIISFAKGYDAGIKDGVKTMAMTFSLTLFFLSSFKRDTLRTTLKSIIIVYGAAALANTISFIICRPSMSPIEPNFYLLGNDNGSIYEASIFMGLSLVYSVKYLKKVPLYLLLSFIVIFMGYCYVSSGNGIAFSSLIILFSIFYKHFPAVLCRLAILAYIFFTAIIVFPSNTAPVEPILKAVGKSPTISGRTIVWAKSSKSIRETRLLGNGFEPTEVTVSKIGYSKTHNLVLQLLYTGGIAMLAVFIAIFLAIILAVEFSTDATAKKCLLFGLAVFLWISAMDFYLLKETTALLFLCTFFESIPKCNISLHGGRRKPSKTINSK